MPQDKVWDDAKPLEQKFPGALLELWKMTEANAKVRRAKARENDPPHWLQSRGPAPAGRKPTEIGNRVSNFFPSFSRFWLDQILKEEPIRHAEFVEAAGRPKLNAAQIKMQRKMQDAEHPRGPTRASIFTGLSGLAQGMQNR